MATTFDILPAIDLRGGRVVRLEQGDFDRATVYSGDPVGVARAFADAGAQWLHVVDLDGARAGEPRHREVIAAIADAVGQRLFLEVAGGLRSEAAVSAVLSAGASRVVVGTAALRDPSFAGRLVARFGAARVAAAIDVRHGQAVGDAWATGAAGADAAAAMAALAEVGVTTFEVTAIDRDGTGDGPDLELYERTIGRAHGDIVASAGIAAVDDIRQVRALGCVGAIIGRAAYDGRLSLEDVLAAASSVEPIVVGRREDGESLGAVRPDRDGMWTALTVFGGTLGRRPTAAAARAVVVDAGLASMARRWFYRSRDTDVWEVVVLQEAWPGRVRAVVGAYALPGAPVVSITAADLDAGDVLTLDPPPEAGLDRFRS